MAKNGKWTIMLYFAGDNELSDDMVAGINGLHEQMKGVTAKDLEFFPSYDPLSSGYPSLLFDFSKERPQELNYEIRTSKDSIFEFVKWCLRGRRNRADRNYALILSGHGDGFQKKSFLNDEGSDSYVKINSLSYILNVIKKSLLDGNKINVLGLDSCVMSSLEFAYQMRDAADYLVASQGYVPFAGYNYYALLDL